MMLGIGREAVIFVCAALTGVVVLSGYEILRLLRRLVPHKPLLVNVEDLLFWLGTSAYLFRQMYLMTYGSIRWFFILGVVCGGFIVAFLMATVKKKVLSKRKKLEKKQKSLEFFS